MGLSTFKPMKVGPQGFDILGILEGVQVARFMSVASFCLTIYDHMLTFDEEVQYFWSGPWATSRILFLVNRYASPMVMMLGIYLFSVVNPSLEFCGIAIRVWFLLHVAALSVIQWTLILRVWHLFWDNKIIRMGIILCFFACCATSMYFLYICVNEIVIFPNFRRKRDTFGCTVMRPQAYWRLYVPSLILHTILYILTTVKALKNRRLLKRSPVLKRLLRDGGFFYFVIFFSVGFSAIGSFLKGVPKLNFPAAFSNFTLAAATIATSRIMLSIHSFAAKLGSDDGWVFNHSELSHMGYKNGAHEGELIVERVTVEDDHSDVETASEVSLKTTRIGVL